MNQEEDDLFKEVDVSEEEPYEEYNGNKKPKEKAELTERQKNQQLIRQKKFFLLKSSIFDPEIMDLVVYIIFFLVYSYYVTISILEFFASNN